MSARAAIDALEKLSSARNPHLVETNRMLQKAVDNYNATKSQVVHDPITQAWAPTHVRKSEHLRNLLARTFSSEEVSVSNGYTKTMRDLGSTFSGFGASDQLVLHEIARRFAKAGERKRVSTVSIGSGQGSLEWKMVTAGAELELIEREKNLAAASLYPCAREGTAVSTKR